jgi:hypothetical protein
MKRKNFIAVAAIVLIAVIALVVLMLEKNNSEFRIQNSELSVTAEPDKTEPQVTPDVIEAEKTEETTAEETAIPAAEETEKTSAEETEAPAAEDKEKTAEEETKASAEDEAKEQPFLVQITEDDPSIGYVLVRMPNPVGLLPLPQEGEYKKTIRVAMPDGSEYINVLHITPNGFWMENANCEGQDCVKQGEVTLENREERILWNMIICLPHQLSAELITREEAEQMLK